MSVVQRDYQKRMQRVLEYIDQHLDGTLDLDELSGVAAFSKFHFHRQFSALFGVSVQRYVQFARMKRASYALAYREAESVTDIAMKVGYEAPDAFARAFRQRFQQSPSQFRQSPDWEPWHAAFGPYSHVRSNFMQAEFNISDVEIREVVATPVAIMKHRGSARRVGDTIRKFIAWRKSTGLTPQVSSTFSVYHSDPHDDPNNYQMDLCAGTQRPVETLGGEVEAGEIPGGRCAVLRILGNSDDLAPAALFLYREWLPDSGEEVRDFPLYCQRLTFFPEVPESEAVSELFLPLKG